MPLCETVLTATPRYSLTQMSLAAPFSCYVSMYLFLTHVSVPLFITNLYIRSPLFSFQQYISWIIFVIYRWFLFVAQGPVFSLSVRSVSCLICQTAGRRRLRKRCGCQGVTTGVCTVAGELQPVQKCTASLKRVKIWPVRRGWRSGTVINMAEHYM